MKPFLVVHATREGHTRRIATRVRETIEACGYSAATDTSCDHDYTDWPALERFIQDFVEQTSESDTASPAPLSLLG